MEFGQLTGRGGRPSDYTGVVQLDRSEYTDVR
jgi:hypothetical protein